MSAICSEGNVLDSPIHLEITYPLLALNEGGGREGEGGRHGEGRDTCPSQLKQQVLTPVHISSVRRYVHMHV